MMMSVETPLFCKPINTKLMFLWPHYDLLVLGSVTMLEGSEGGPTPQWLEARTLNW